MPIKLNGSTSGYVQLQAAAVAGSNNITLPTTNGTANQLMQTDGTGTLSYATITAGTGVTVTNGTGTITIASSSVGGFSNMAVATYTAASNSSGSSLVWNSSGSLTWTVPTGITTARITILGGGGGGGAARTNNGGDIGNGGGGGGYAQKVVTGLTPAGAITVTVGNGGAGGATTGATGATGGTTSVGAPISMSATGGTGGTLFGSPSNANSTNGGAGGTSSSGQLNLSGKTAQSLVYVSNATYSGSCTPTVSVTYYVNNGGGDAPAGLGFGGWRPPSSTGGVGTAGVGFGSGGSGAVGVGSGTSAGGAGANGIVIIEW